MGRKRTRTYRAALGFCCNHPQTPVLAGRSSCARCLENNNKSVAMAKAAGICMNHRRERRDRVPGRTLCQECLWRLSEFSLKKEFGLSIEEYARMEHRQNMGCAICKRRCPSGKALAVDHDHKTGRIRGPLCIDCNRISGYTELRASVKAFGDYLKDSDAVVNTDDSSF